MTRTLTLDPEKISNFSRRSSRYGDRLCETEVREDYLHKVARLVSDEDVTTELGAGAFSRNDGPESFYIQVPSDPSKQTRTSLSDEVWNLLFQETVLFHELGHVLWTDFDYLEARLEGHDSRTAETIRSFWNAMEDPAVNTYLASEFNVREDLRVVNENLAEMNRQDISGGLTPIEALEYGMLEQGLIEENVWSDILEGDIRVRERDVFDKYKDQVRDTMVDYIRTSDPRDRIDIAIDLATDILDDIEEDYNKRSDSPKETSQGDGSDESGGSSIDDAPEMDPEEIEEMQGETTEVAEDEIEDKYEDEVQNQKSSTEEDDEDTDEMEQTLRMICDAELSTDEIQVPDDWEMDPENGDSVRVVERRARSLARTFRAKLQNERNTRRRYGLDDGLIESTDLAKAVTGSQNFRSREAAPEDKSYSVQIVLDRSGSMANPNWDELDEGPDTVDRSDRRVKRAQEAVASLARGLYDVGVDVSVMSLYNNETCLEVPFGADPETRRDVLFSNKTAGRTPLAGTLEVAKENVEEGAWDEEFVIVVCDGEPDSVGNYKNQLREIDCPVYGVYINEEIEKHRGKHDDLFDVIRYADLDDVGDRLSELAKRIIG